MLPVDLNSFLQTVGYIGIWLIIFAETGLLIGFFLPGDSLLFTAGFLASQQHFDIGALIAVCFSAAVIGDAVGYSFGHRIGRGLFRNQIHAISSGTTSSKRKSFLQNMAANR